MAGASVISGGLNPPSLGLSSDDQSYFDQAWPQYVQVVDYQGIPPLTAILNPMKSLFQAAAGMAKSAFSGASFGGLTDNQGFNMQQIRAVTLRTQNAAADVYDWAQNIDTTGWAALFGSETSPYNTGTNNSLGPTDAAYTLGNVFFLFTHLVSPTPPLFDEIQFGVGSVKYAVQTVSVVQISDVYVISFPLPIVVPVNQKYWVMANFRRTGTENTRPIGAQFVLSNYAALR